MFDLVENRLYAYADDSTLLAVIRRPYDRPTVAASVNRDLARIHEWCGRWCMLLNPRRAKPWWSVDPGQSTLPMVTWACLVCPYCPTLALTFLG